MAEAEIEIRKSMKKEENEKIWILPPGRRGAMEAGLAESAAMLLRFSTEDFRLLQSARTRTRRIQRSGSGLCSKSVEAAQSAVAKAVAVARDVKAEQGRREYFFSSTKKAENVRHARSRSPSPARPNTSIRKETPSKLQSANSNKNPSSLEKPKRARSSSPVATERIPRPAWGRSTPPRSRSPSPASRTPTPSTPKRPVRSALALKSHSDTRGRDASIQKTATHARTATQRARSSSPASVRNNTKNSTNGTRPSHDDIVTESPEELSRQIKALTLDLERLKERHRRALEVSKLKNNALPYAEHSPLASRGKSRPSPTKT